MSKIIQYGTSFNENYPINNNIVFNNNTLYNINDVTVETNLTPRVVIDYTSNYYIDGKSTSLSDLNISNIGNNDFLNKVVLSFDKTNLNNYARFGNLKDLMVSCIQGIILSYPASLYVTYFSDGKVYDNVFDYVYDPITKTSSFKVNTFLVSNPYNINYVKPNTYNQSTHTSSSTEYDVNKDLNMSYNDYELYYVDPNNNTIEKTYGIVGFTGSTSNNGGYLTFKVIGDGFNIFSASTFNYNFHIRPNGIQFNKFYNTLNTLQKYLLNQEKYNKNTSLFKTIEEDIDNNISFKDNKYTWPTSDGYNLDYNTPQYNIYFNNLINISESYDKLKSNLILRFLTPQSLIDYDASVDDRIGKLLKIYGREFDEIKSFIDGIVYVNKVSYDGVENIPNIWIKNLANSLGWETFNIVDSKDFINDILTPNLNDGVSKTDTPYEVDIELWRRIIVNTNWFFQNKGTRRAIETIFSFVGAPECLVDFNEHIYTVSGKIDVNSVDQTIINSYGFTRLPYDTNGNPKAPNETNDFNFQVAGNNDMGQTYINLYRQLGFDVIKTIDNKKSWEYYSGNTRRTYDVFATDYTQESNELIINSKEVSINLDLAQAIECDIYSFNYDHNYPVSNYADRGYPYPNRDSVDIDVQTLSFAEYVQTVYSKFINAQNHKIIDDARGGGYPTLYKLYSDYLNNTFIDTGFRSNERNIGFMLEYIKSIGGIFDRFIKQLIPATTIFDGLGEKYRNTIFTPQKFVYQAGIDAGSEFQTNQNTFNKQDEFNIVKISGGVSVPTNGSINTYFSLGSYQYSPDGNLTDIDNENFIKIDRILNFWNNQHWDSNTCYLDIPQYFVNGAVKIEPDQSVYCISTTDFIYDYLNIPINLYLSCLLNPTGYTSVSQVFYEEYYNAVHYYDVESFKEVEFVFTSKTDIDMFTSNTISFGYNVNKYNKNTLNFDNAIIYNNSLSNYDIYSGNTLVFRDSINNSYLSRDAEYLLKPYFIKSCELNQFEPYSGVTSPLNSYENFNFVEYNNQYNANNSLNHFTPNKSIYNSTGFTINTSFDYNVVNNLEYKYYDVEFDYYFSSVGTPDKPILGINSVITPNDNSGVRYVVEQIPIDAIGMTAFTTTYNPKNDLQLTFNGLVLTPNIEYYKDNLNISNLNKRYVMTNPILYNTDIIVASYLTDDLNSSNIVFDCESYIVSSITTNGTGVSNSIKFAYNTGTTKYEYYLNSGITNINNINFVINGSTMTNGVDFTISMFDTRKIILNVSPIIIGDEFNVCYTQTILVDDVYLIPSNPYDFSWSIINPTPTNEIGYFTQEFYDKNDLSLSTIIYSSTTNYIPLTTNYTQSINFLSASTLNYGQQYRYRVKSQRYFSALTGNNLEIDNYSDVVVVEIPS